jgi:Leucine-rich repeat (LRR) protein
MQMKNNKLLLCIFGIVFILFQCAPVNNFAGGSGTETVGGCALDTNNVPIAGATVSLCKSDFLDTQSVVSLKKRSLYLAETRTDIHGNYSFGLVDTGFYAVELNEAKQSGALARCTVKKEDSIYLVSTLQSPGVVSGKVTQAPEAEKMKFWVFVYGCPKHTATTDDSGNFTIANIPDGKYDFEIISQSPLYKAVTVSGVVVGPGKTTILDSIEPPQSAISIDYNDSMCVRAILDSNNKQKITVESVATVDAVWPHRVIALFLKNKSLSTIPPIIGKLNKLRSLDISVNPLLKNLPNEIAELTQLNSLFYYGNKDIIALPPIIGRLYSLDTLNISVMSLDTLPSNVIQNLHQLKYLNAGSNSFRTFPRAIENCSQLRYLNISNNDIQFLPVELAQCSNLDSLNASDNLIDSIPIALATSFSSTIGINIDRNHLCQDSVNNSHQVSPEMKTWLDAHTVSNWEKNQICKGNYQCIP